MPTGYTAGFQDRDVSFNEFVWTAARGFGAFIHMRDSSVSDKIELPKLDDYQTKQLAKAQKELDELKNMSLKTAGLLLDKSYEKQIADAKEGLAKHKALRDRYNKVLDQAKAWKPPTKDHQGLKDFMIQQLESSIQFDCDDKYYEEILAKPRGTAAEWLKQQIKHVEWSVTYHTEQVAKEKAGFKNQIQWIEALQAAVPMESK